MTKCFVGNLPFSTTSEELHDAFEQFGKIRQANIVNDRETGNSRGFGFVEFSAPEEVQEAIANMNGVMMGGRELKVSLARPRGE